MCGIVGFTGPSKPDLLREMSATIHHRGPDDEGYYESPEVSLGMRRLAILDVDTGRQPMSNEDETVWVVFNGEIYNHQQLRNNLVAQGHIFRTSHADTETVVHAFEEYGIEWPGKSQANGMFGLAVWEVHKKRLYLYRDRMGKKPLYYSQVGANIIFGSEIKSILCHPDVSKELDPGSLYQYFGLKNISAPATAYRQVRQLPPGHCLIWENGDVVVKPWWSLNFTPLPDINETEAALEIRNLLEDAVRLRMDCDVPYGAYLSGGVDSSSVATLMARFQTKPLKTFCLGYSESDNSSGSHFAGKAQDIHYAREISRNLGTEHYELFLSAEDFVKALPEVVKAFDEPFSGTVSTFFLSILMREHVKVAVSGDGADELFGSYLAHRLASPMTAWLRFNTEPGLGFNNLPEQVRLQLKPFDSLEGMQFLDKIADSHQAVWRDKLAVYGMKERETLLQRDFLEASGTPADPYEVLEKELTAKDPLNRVLETDQLELLANQVLPFVDRLSMAHSIEVRCPFLDYRLVEFVNRLPASMKINQGQTKRVLKLAIADLLPKEVIDRPKEGFVQPIYTWMHGPLQRWTLDRLTELPAEIFQHDAIEVMKKKLLQGDMQVNAKLWNLVCFSIWWRTAIR